MCVEVTVCTEQSCCGGFVSVCQWHWPRLVGEVMCSMSCRGNSRHGNLALTAPTFVCSHTAAPLACDALCLIRYHLPFRHRDLLTLNIHYNYTVGYKPPRKSNSMYVNAHFLISFDGGIAEWFLRHFFFNRSVFSCGWCYISLKHLSDRKLSAECNPLARKFVNADSGCASLNYHSFISAPLNNYWAAYFFTLFTSLLCYLI